MDSNHIDSLNSLGYTLAVQNKSLDIAEGYIRKALNFRPHAGYIVDSLGWVYFQRGDYKKAQTLIERAYHLSLDDTEILDHLGEIYNKLGDKTKARESWERALEIDPESKEIERKLKKVTQ
jgi:Flp pilus assembly protein TadD